MNRIFPLLISALVLQWSIAFAQPAPSGAAEPAGQSAAGRTDEATAPNAAVEADLRSSGTGTQTTSAPAAQVDEERAKTATTAAVAAVAARDMLTRRPAHEHPDLLEQLVDAVLSLFNISSSGNTWLHYAISLLFLVIALLARRIVTGVVFVWLRKLSAKTETTLDDKLFPALEPPASALIVVAGILAALKVLKLPPGSGAYITNGSTIAFSLVVFWGLWRALGALLDHAQDVSRQRQLGIAAFMPWIKKTILSVFVVFGVLLTIQSMGYDVKALLAGLGIGGLAFALAAQDTLANVFGSIVVATDQPFKIGEAIKIGGEVGIVEDIGLRSTRLRMVDKSLKIIPNKTVASEMITNFSRFTRRRHEQVLGLTYDTTPEQMAAIVEEIRNLILARPEVDKSSVVVFFRDFSASSLDIWLVYELPNPDFAKAMEVRQRLNQAFMKAVAARGLSFAFPTQTVQLAGTIAERLAPPAPAAPLPRG